MIINALQCDELSFQLITHQVCDAYVTSWIFNSSHYKRLTINVLHTNVTSDEFLFKKIYEIHRPMRSKSRKRLCRVIHILPARLRSLCL